MTKNEKNETTHLRSRVSSLSDRVLMLEADLQRTKEKISADMNRLIELVRAESKGGR